MVALREKAPWPGAGGTGYLRLSRILRRLTANTPIATTITMMTIVEALMKSVSVR